MNKYNIDVNNIEKAYIRNKIYRFKNKDGQKYMTTKEIYEIIKTEFKNKKRGSNK